MMNFSENVVISLTKNGIIPSDETEVYAFGLKQVLFMLLNIITTLIIGLAFGMLAQSVSFMLSFLPLRSFAGGYHAKTQLRCYLLSIATIIVVLWGIKYIPWTGLVCVILLALASGTIFFLAPVGSKNKPLDEREKIVYRKRSRIILGCLIVTGVLFWFINFRPISACILMALVVLAIILVLARIQNVFSTFQSSRNNLNKNGG